MKATSSQVIVPKPIRLNRKLHNPFDQNKQVSCNLYQNYNFSSFEKQGGINT